MTSIDVGVEAPIRTYGLLRIIFDSAIVFALIFAIVQLSSWVIFKLLG
jgi:hypothetical protein